jgi:hypothetical protein
MNNKLIIILLTFETALFSQGKDIKYLDVGVILAYESNFGIGLNYERTLNNNVSFRTGFNVSFDIDKGPSFQTILGLPVGFIFFTGANNRFELGAESGGKLWIAGSHAGEITPGPFLRIGYRYQKKNEMGRFFKAGLEMPCNNYLSLFGGGYSY